MEYKQTPTQVPLPIGVVMFKPPVRCVSAETIQMLQQLLDQAHAGKITGLALVGLHADGRFELHLTGDATSESSQMGVAGMLAGLQKMALELY
ncbi:MAG: hypothetical protein V4858_09845 [Pseudomonadota bacterium]